MQELWPSGLILSRNIDYRNWEIRVFMLNSSIFVKVSDRYMLKSTKKYTRTDYVELWVLIRDSRLINSALKSVLGFNLYTFIAHSYSYTRTSYSRSLQHIHGWWHIHCVRQHNHTYSNLRIVLSVYAKHTVCQPIQLYQHDCRSNYPPILYTFWWVV